MATLRYINNSRTGEPGTLVEMLTPLQFGDDDSYIEATSAGVLEIVAGTELILTAPTITGDLTFTGAQTLSDILTIGTRTASTALSISTGGALTGINVGVVYDAAGVANTTDYIGTAGIFNYIHGVECKSGGNVTSGMATIWANYEIDYQVYGSGGLSAGWFTIWADAAGDAAHIRSSAGARALHLQGVDIALVSGSAFDLGTNCDLFGLRIDSSIDDSATLSGHFYGINIAKSSSGKGDWQIGVDINDSTTGVKITDGTTAINIEGTVTLALGIGTTTALTTATTGQSAIKVYSDLSGNGYNVPVWVTGAITGANANYGSMYCIRGDAKLTGVQTTQGNHQFVVGVHGRARVSGTVYNSNVTIAGVMSQLLAGGTYTEVENVCSLWVDNQLATNPTTGEVSMVLITQNNSSSSAIVDNVFKVQGGGGTDTHFAYLFNFVKDITGGFISADIGATAIHKTICRKIKINIDDVDYYLLASTEPATA